MLNGLPLAESLRLDTELCVPGLTVADGAAAGLRIARPQGSGWRGHGIGVAAHTAILIGPSGFPPVWGLAPPRRARYIRLHVRTGGCP
jgi:hypothetical protein